MSFVYLLVSTKGNTYVGATIDLNRRLRQHNKEIKGGAHATGIKVAQGEVWTRAAHVSGFPDWQATLQFEWRWKHLSRKYPIKMEPNARNIQGIAIKNGASCVCFKLFIFPFEFPKKVRKRSKEKKN